MSCKRTKVQVAENTDQIIIDYLATSEDIDKYDAQEIYNYCVSVGEEHGTTAFDKAIELSLEELGLCSNELSKLTSVEA
jgi:hypothetical protein